MSSNTSEKTLHRIPELDGVRGLAVLLVILWHYVGCQLQPTGIFSKIILFSTKLFWSGVDLFFVLSGFLIGGILLANKGSKNYFKTFYIRRIFRIFPLYYLLVFCYLLFICFDFSHSFSWLIENPMPIWSYITFTQNYFMGAMTTYGNNWLAITWSLAVEEQFYLLLPLFLFLLPDKKIPIFLILAILMAPLMRFLLHNFHAFVSLFCRMDSLLLGVLLAYFTSNNKYSEQIKNNKRNIYIIFSILIIGLIVMHFKSFGPIKNTWLAFLYTFLIIIAVHFKESKLSTFMRNSLLRKLGAISYGVYIFHQLVSGLLHQLILNDAPKMVDVNSFMVTLFALIITVIVSVISYRFYEAPLLKIGHRYTY